MAGHALILLALTNCALVEAHVQRYVKAWGAEKPVFRCESVKASPCETTTDGYGPIVSCDPAKIGYYDKAELARHEVTHILRKDYEYPDKHGRGFWKALKRARQS